MANSTSKVSLPLTSPPPECPSSARRLPAPGEAQNAAATSNMGRKRNVIFMLLAKQLTGVLRSPIVSSLLRSEGLQLRPRLVPIRALLVGVRDLKNSRFIERFA